MQILLGYLPKNQDDWATELAKKRAEYMIFRDEMIINPVCFWSSVFVDLNR